MQEEMKRSAIHDFWVRLRQLTIPDAEDRGALADLRHGFSPGTEYRAWPYIVSVCNLQNDTQRRIWLTVSAGFATHKATDPRAGNMGATLRTLAKEPGESRNEPLKSFDARFRRFLTCDNVIELCERLRGIILAAHRKNIGIDYEGLLRDLQGWREPEKRSRVKLRWAQSYWREDESKGGETVDASDTDPNP
jgi:CRISPR type I-E-associated protein CasB/Cse2